jgi:hypothetical protein
VVTWPEVDELLTAVTRDSDRTDGEEQFGLAIRLQEFIRSGERAGVLRLLEAVHGPLPSPDGGWFLPPVSAIIVGVVSRFPGRALAARLVDLDAVCAPRADPDRAIAV